jgi:hypothetical protein
MSSVKDQPQSDLDSVLLENVAENAQMAQNKPKPVADISLDDFAGWKSKDMIDDN